MADNSTQGGADTIRDKDRAGVKTQIFGIDVGIGTGTEVLLSSTNPLPVQVTAGDPDLLVAGTITTPDIVVNAPTDDGVLRSGASTAGSYVYAACVGGDSTWTIQVNGLSGGGTVYFEESFDSTTGADGKWISMAGRRLGIMNTTMAFSTTATNGIWQGTHSGATFIRVRAVGALSGSTPDVVIRQAAGISATYLDAALPSGTNTLGTMNVLDPDSTGSGTITTTDIVVGAPAGAGALVSGSSTLGSYVTVPLLGGDSAWIVQITGLTSGTLYFEESIDSTNGINGSWVNVNGCQTGIVNTVLAGNATTNGVWRGNTSGAVYWRIRSVGALTGSPAIVFRASGGTGAIFLNASIPAGSNMIGSVTGSGTAGTPATGVQTIQGISGGTPQNVTPVTSTTPTVTGVAASATSVTILTSNTARRLATITNDSSSATLYLRLGAVAAAISSGNYTVPLVAGAYYEVPGSYTGEIRGIWAAATGFANVTEVT